MDYYNNNFEIGEPIEVFIKSDNPQDAIVPGLGGGINIILIIVCIVNVVIFFVLYGVAISIKRRRKKLQKLYNKPDQEPLRPKGSYYYHNYHFLSKGGN